MQEDDHFVVDGARPLGPLPEESFGKLIYDHLLTNFHKDVALVDSVTDKTISYRELLDLSCCLAEWLLEMGCGRNKIISISSENTMEYFIPIMSALYIGAIVAPIYHNNTEPETLHCLDIAKPEIIFCSKAVLEKYLQIKSQRSYIKKIIVINSDEEFEGVETLHLFLSPKLVNYDHGQFEPAKFDSQEQIALIIYSSGTTGLPKGVMLSHRSLVARYMHSLDNRFMNSYPDYLGFILLFHTYGLLTCLIGIMLGQKIIIMKQYEEEPLLANLEKYKIRQVWALPSVLGFLAKSPLVDKYDLSSIYEISSAAAPLSRAIEKAVKERIKPKFLRQGYGLTEVTHATHMMPLNCERSGSCGTLLPYMKIKIRNPETGQSLGPNQVGELCLKGPLIMKGYYDNEEATKIAFTSDGWLRTGDMGYYDDDHFFFIVDRLKELIKWRGAQVPPAELEAVLMTHPKVADAGVIGIPDEEAGELPLAYIVKNPRVEVTEQEILTFVEERVALHKRLRGGIIFIPRIPRNPTGKILRRELRLLYSKKGT